MKEHASAFSLDYRGQKHVELPNVTNKINHQILCILLDYRYDSTLSLTSALDVGGWLTPCSGRFTPRIDLVTLCIGGRVGPRDGLDGCGKSRPPYRIRSPDRPARGSVAVSTELSRPMAD